MRKLSLLTTLALTLLSTLITFDLAAAQTRCRGNRLFYSGSYAPALTNYDPRSVTAQTSSVLSITIFNTDTRNCPLGFSFERSGTPVMTLSGNTLQYTAINGTNTIIHTPGPPGPSNRVDVLVPAGGSAVINYQIQVPAGQIVPASGSSSYVDSLVGLRFDWLTAVGGNVVQNLAVIPTTISDTVIAYCAIAGTINSSQTITVSSVGLTTGMGTAAPQFNVTCNNQSSVSLASFNGAVTLGGVGEGSLGSVPGFRNRIEYQASINGGAGAVTLNTASTASIGPSSFASAPVTTQSTSVTITPETSSTPLVPGSYSDTLRITLTPN
jgi:hypothetical protein